SYLQPNTISDATVSGIADGSIDVLRDVNKFPVTFEQGTFAGASSSGGQGLIKDYTLRLAGHLPWTLPGGQVALSALIERRDESLGRAGFSFSGFQLFRPAQSQSINSAYVEGSLPFVSPSNALPYLNLLELEIAVRRDSYDVKGVNGILLPGQTIE